MLFVVSASARADTLWTTGKALMPAWGFYPNGEIYDGTKSLEAYSAWLAGRLTWVADFPSDGDYEVFVRRYAGFGGTVVRVDEATPVKGGGGWTPEDNASNNRYRWAHLGRVRVTKGPHHVDLDVEGMLDAVVFTTDSALDPSKDKMPDPLKQPVLRAPRRYRDDSHLKHAVGGRGFVVSSLPPYEEILNDYVPAANQLLAGKGHPSPYPLPQALRPRAQGRVGERKSTNGHRADTLSPPPLAPKTFGVGGEDQGEGFRQSHALRLWGAADQYVNGTFCVRALRDTQPLVVSLKQLVGPISEQRSPSPLSSPPAKSRVAASPLYAEGRGNQRLRADRGIPSPPLGPELVAEGLGGEGRVRGAAEVVRIGAAEIDLRVVHLRRRTLSFIETVARSVLLPDLLLRDDRTAIPPKGKQGGYGGGQCVTAIPAHESRQFWITVRVPAGAPPGVYKGTIRLQNTLFRGMSLPIEVDVLPIDLKPVEGHYAMFHPSHPIPPEVQKRDGNFIKPERYRAELQDQVRHGCNAATLYGGPATLSYAKEAGMMQAPVVLQWPGADPYATQYVAQAKAMGFPDLYFYGVDEPREPERLEQCRKEAEWRRQNGFHMFTAINTRESYEVLKDLVDRPVLSMNAFSGPDNPAVLYARSKGFVPVSYWMASTHDPVWHRALAGLYNTRCGFLGSTPWCYQDFIDQRVYDANDWFQAVSYPDEFEQPIPSLAWEGYRAGVDDVRYLQALDRAMIAADERLKRPDPLAGLAVALAKARAIRKARFESIDGQYWQYLCNLKRDVLAASRREMAESIVEIIFCMPPV